MLRDLSPRWQKVIGDLRTHPSRSILVVVAMVIGLAGAGSVLDTWSLMRQVTRQEYLASNPPSATIRVEAMNTAAVDQVRAMPEIAEVQARRTVNANVTVPYADTPSVMILFALADFQSQRIGRIKGEEGQWPPSDGGLVIEHSSVEYAGVKIGDSLLVQVDGRAAVRVPVTGIARDVGLAPGWMEHVVYAFALPSTLEQLGASASFNELLVVVRDSTLDREGIRGVTARVTQRLADHGVVVASIDVPEPGQHIHAAQIDSLLFTQGAFGVLALILSCVMVMNLVTAMLSGQVREIGVMKTLGASPQQIAGMYLTVAFVLGAIATLIAIPLAAIIGRAYADFTANVLNFNTDGFAIPVSAFVLQLAVGLTLPVVTAAVPVIRGCRISVGDALRDVGISATGTSRSGNANWQRFDAIGGIMRPLLLSLRNAFRKRQRMTLTLATLGLGGGVYIGSLNMQKAVHGAVDLVYQAQRYDMTIRLGTAANPDSLERVARAVTGVAEAEAWSTQRATLIHADSVPGLAFSVQGLPTQSALYAPDRLDGRWLLADDERALVVNKRLLMADSSIAVGATVTLRMAGRPQAWRIVGVVSAGLQPMAFAPRQTVAAIADNGRVDRVMASTVHREPAAQLAAMQQLRAALVRNGFEVQSGQMMTEARAVTEDHMVMVAAFLGVMGQLMIVVGGLALASTMGMAVLERTREIGVMRAIGARHGAITTMILVEGLVIALLGWAIAIPLSLPMSVMLGKAFGRIMLPLPVIWVPDMTGVLRWLVVVLIVSVASCAWPAWRATRITTKAALSYE